MNDLLATWEKELSAPIAKKLYALRDVLSEEFKSKNALSLDSIIKVIGKPPVIPASPDMDSMLEAWDERAKYGKDVITIEKLIKEYAN